LLAHTGDWLGVSRLPGLFASAGIRTTILARPNTLLNQSRFVDERLLESGDLDAFVATLRSTLEARRFSFVILADDQLVDAVAAHAGAAWLDACFPVDHRSSAVRMLLSKFDFLEAAKAANLPLPRSKIVTVADAPAAARGIGYPVMAKRRAGTGGAGVRKAHDQAELEAAIAAFGDPDINIEEYIDGIVGGTEVLFDHGRPVCWVSLEKLKRYPGPFGPSATRLIVEPAGIADLLTACGALTGYHGFAGICWQFDAATGRLAMLELNPRQGSGMHLAPEAAAIFSQGLLAVIEGRSEGFVFTPVPSGTIYRMFPQDLKRAIEQRDLPGFLAWLPGRRTARDIPWNDRPLLRALVRDLVYTYAPMVPRAATFARRMLRRAP
jgi:predicted ATP-grasp superfamily ATP-dependent carboligase